MSGFADITVEVVIKVIGHTFDIAFIMVTSLLNESNVMLDKGTSITLGDEKPEKKKEENSLAFFLFFFSTE